MKINAKMLVSILSTTILILFISVGYITLKSRQMALEEARETTNNKAHEYVNLIKYELVSDFNIAKALAQAGQAFQSLSWDEWNKIFLEQQLQILTENPHYLAVATSWELKYIDPEWDKAYGRYMNGWVRNEKGISQIEIRLNTDGDDLSSDYFAMKSTGNSMIADPELWSPTGKVEDQYINTNFSVPIKLGATFVGLAGIDIDLQKFQTLIEKINPFENSQIFLLSNNGTYVTHPNPNLIGKLISDEQSEFNERFNIVEKIQAGESFSITYKNENNQKDFYAFAPLNIENANTSWSLVLVVPYQIITLKAKLISSKAILVSIIGLLLLTIVIWLIAKNITNPVKKVTEVLKNLAKGKIDHSLIMDVKTQDEIGEMTLALNTSIHALNEKTNFANQIGSGNLDANLQLLGNEDKLGESLLNMQKNLQKTRDIEKERKLQEELRQWTNEGLAKFATILRQNNNDLNILAHDIIKNMVLYVNANQGGIFIRNDIETTPVVFDLLSAFAFDRQKFIKKQIELGEGLVGSCAKEKETILLTEIPQNYIQIVSGLGGANPSSVLLVPLKFENDVLGVIEMASFNTFKKHEIEFAEKVAENIASALKSVRINITTSQLLEQSQQQAEEMAAQEEEMRQNMEELQATQEESTRKGEEIKGMLDAMDSFLVKAEFDLNAVLFNANDLFLSKFMYKMKEAVGLEIEEFVADKSIVEFQKILNKVMSGKNHQEVSYLKTKKGKELKLVTSFTPVFVNDELHKILLMAIDITDFE